MTTYEVRTSGEFYSLIGTGLKYEDSHREEIAHRVFYGETLTPIWSELKCTQLDQSLPLGNFMRIDILGSLMVVLPSTLNIEAIAGFLSEAGELLPITIDGSPAHIVHTFRRIDAVNLSQSDSYPLSTHVTSNRPTFYESRLPNNGGLFRVTEAWNRVFIAEPDEGGFKAAYEDFSLTGLTFVERSVTGDD